MEMRAHAFAEPFRVDDGKKLRLEDVDPGDTLDLTSEDKPRAQELAAAKRARARGG